MTTLTDKAMLVRLQIAMWSGRRFDREVSDEVADIHGTTREAGRFNKLLLPKSCFAKVGGAITALRTHHDTETLPWDLRGVALLPSANYFAYSGEYRRLRVQFDVARADFLAEYPAHKERAKTELADLYREDDYPSVERLAGQVAVDLQIWPLPDAKDFRVSLGDAEEARIRDSIERSVNAQVESAVRSLWDRVHGCVSAMHDRLTKYQPANPETGENGKNPFRDTLVTNMRDLVELLPRLNVTADAALDSMAHRLKEKLCGTEPDDLRKNESLRRTQADECAAILQAMSAYTGTVAPLSAAA